MDKVIDGKLNRVLKEVKIYNNIGYITIIIMLIITVYLAWLYYMPLYSGGSVELFSFFWLLIPFMVTYSMYRVFNFIIKKSHPYFQFNLEYVNEMIQLYKNGNISTLDIDMNIVIGIYDFSDKDDDAKISLKRSMRKILKGSNYRADDRLRKNTADLIEYVNKK
jgi:hypothetical protein